MNKKAFEMQFNWLFILVAGAAILLFFSVVVIKQKSVSETSTKATVLKSIEAIITGAGVSTDTTNIVDIPNSNIEVGCSRISIGGVSTQLQAFPLFAPSFLKGDKLITQTLGFNAPYRATNLLYITSPQIRYILVGDSSLAREVNRTLPVELKKEFYSKLPEIKNSNNYMVRFIVFGDMIEPQKSLVKMPDSDVSVLRIIGDEEKGTVEFWQKDGNSWLAKGTSGYIGKSSLIGAAYADTLDMYDCNMKNAFLRLSIVTRVHLEKTKNLISGTPGSGRQLQCNQFYSSALSQLGKILDLSARFNSENAFGIAGFAGNLANENKNAQVYSCPLIY